MAIETNSPNGIPAGWNTKNITPAPNVTNTRRVQLLRNKDVHPLDFFIGEQGLWKQETFISQLKDGEQILGRYQGDDNKPHTLYGIVHNEGNNIKYITIFKTSINANEVGDGITSERNVVELKISEGKGLSFNETLPDGKRSLKLNLKNGSGLSVNGGELNISKDNSSIVSKSSKLSVGTVDCGDWVI